jgi:hypothetical protein
MKHARHVAWILIVLVDAGFVAWGAMAAAWPDLLPGPGGMPILTAGYEGFTKGSWIVNAIGPFELSEYLGLVIVYAALAVTAPFLQAEWQMRSAA